jgi:hypothetical protein
MASVLAFLTISCAAGYETLAYDWYEWSVASGGNGHLYAITDHNGWHDAEAEALAQGGHLVTINNASENQFLVDTFGAMEFTNREQWIGFTDEAAEDTWRWAAGDGGYWVDGGAGSTSYTNWAVGTPSKIYEDDDYGSIALGTTAMAHGDTLGEWGNTTPANARVGIMEVVPEPAIVSLTAAGVVALLRRRRS